MKNIACTGYIFDGWYNQAGERIAEIPQGSIGKLVLEARWSLENYAIKYANTKDVSNSNVTSYTIESGTITLKPISIAGYDFVGWFDENENLVTEIASGSTGNITLTARWTAITYKIEYKNTKGADNDNVADYTIESSDIELKKISVNGYIFNGWFNQAGEEVKVISKGSINDLVLEARWTPEVYTIEYKNTKNSSNANPTRYNIETRTITLVNLECDGYVFNGWYDASGTKVDEIPVGSIGDITLKAEWSVVNYRIVYNNTKGAENTNLTEFNIESDDIQLKDISVAGFRFDGWYNTSGTKVTVIPTGSMGEIVLEAKWTANSYIVKYDSNGGIGDMSDSNHTYGESKKLNANAFTRRGYTFAGWSLSPDGSVVYENLAAVENLTVDNNGVVRLYAQWSCITYEIKFETNGGELIDSIYYTIESAEFNLPATVLMAGKTFIGWYDNAALSGDMVLSIANGTVGNKTYYAKWSNWHTYEIVYDANGGIGVMENSNYTYGVLKKLSGCTFTKQGYKFIGWSTTPDGEVAYENLESVKNLTAENNVEVTLYAQWVCEQYEIVFDSKGGSSISKVYYTIESETFELNNSEWIGRTFLGWYDSNGQKVSSIIKGSFGNRNYEARWSDWHTYTIVYDANGGTGITENSVHTYSLMKTLTANGFEKNGYKFIGWSDTPNGEIIYSNLASVINLTVENEAYITLYAKWQAREFIITYVINDGDREKTQSYTPDDETIELYAPIYSSYPEYNEFIGWYDETLTVKFDDDSVATLLENPDNITLYGKWNEITRVYNGIASLPTDISSGRFIVDLSTHTGSNACDKTINVTNASEVIFIGNTEATFTNLHIIVKDYTEKQVKLIFVDFNMTGDITDSNNPADMKVTIECKGTSTITATSTSTAAIDGFANLTIEGDDNLSVTGAKASDTAGTGGIAINVANLDIDINGILTVIGGDGATGAKGYDGDGDPENGGPGGQGGTGGVGIKASNVNFTSGTIYVNGGAGGKGGTGGKGDKSNSIFDGEGNGGNGGTGGTGGVAIQTDIIEVTNDVIANITGGDGGYGGDGGSRGGGTLSDGSNGSRGAGGTGGKGISITFETSNRNVTVKDGVTR